MSTQETKILLYDLIENSDEKLIPILYSLALEYNHQHFQMTEEMLDKVHERRRKHLDGKSKSYTWEEAKEIIRSRFKK